MICSKCHIEKNENEFHKAGQGKRRRDCKKCCSIIKRKYYKEKTKNKVKKPRKKPKVQKPKMTDDQARERNIERSRKYYQQNKTEHNRKAKFKYKCTRLEKKLISRVIPFKKGIHALSFS